ncbi:MAG TPA: acyl-CoA dehydrogenase family protein, partial [Spirochaetota bacterium]|nr:acyl-CoA dehydrogenase family protein [Spirochaetota bacterium]
EYPVSRFYVDARIQTIYAGTSEVMKMIVSRMMGL